MAAAADSPQQGIQSIEVGAQVLRALEAGRPSSRRGGAAPDGRGEHRRGLHLAAEGSERPYHQCGGVDRERTDHRPLGLGHSRAAAQRAGRLGAAAARLGRRLDVPGTPADRADRRRAGHPAGPAGDPYSRPRRAGEASGRSAARRDRELAAPDDLRHGGRSAPPYSAPTGTSCSRSASPCPPACSCKARRTGWPTRSAAPPGRSRRNWDTARRNAPAPTRPQRWRR
jgi:hypothetical protein